MSTESIVALLVPERDKLNRAIEALEGKETEAAAHRERHVATPAPVAVEPAAPTKKKRGWTAAHRKAHTERMKAYWVAKRKAAKK